MNTPAGSHIHDFRHAFISQMVSNGVPLAVAGAVAGHKDPKTTMRYARCGKNVVADAARLAAGKIAGAGKGEEQFYGVNKNSFG